jgi:hypothetical protein
LLYLMSVATIIAAPLWIRHVHGWNNTCGCASTSHVARASEFGQEEVVVRVARGGV